MERREKMLQIAEENANRVTGMWGADSPEIEACSVLRTFKGDVRAALAYASGLVEDSAARGFWVQVCEALGGAL